MADGERHLRLRRLLLPPFHGEALRRHRELIRATALEDVRRWPLGEPHAVLPRMRAITLEVILSVVLGVRDERRRERLREVLPGVLGVSVMAMLAEGVQPRLFGGRIAARVFPWLRARRAAERLLEEEIAVHRADPDGRDDVLALLLATRDENGQGLSDGEVRDQLLTLLVAGHETTAGTLAGPSSGSCAIPARSHSYKAPWRPTPVKPTSRPWSTRRSGCVRRSTRSCAS